jgi:hypothetical protein
MAIIIKTKRALDGCGQVCLRFSLIDGLTSWAVQAAGPFRPSFLQPSDREVLEASYHV